MNYAITFLLVMITTGFSDVCWVQYIIKSGEKKALAASLWGTVIIILSGITIISYTHDKTFLIASAIGAFTGTYLTIRFSKK